MQISSVYSLSSHPSVDANASLPLISNIVNIDTRPQTTIFMREAVIASTCQNPVLFQLQSIKQGSQSLSEESQFISILNSLSELDELYYDENMMKLLIKNNDPRKYYYAELFTSALHAQAAWYRAKNRVLDLLYFTPLKKERHITSGKTGFAIAITNLITNKIKHQSYLNKIKSKNFDDLPSNANSASRQKTNQELDNELKNARRVLARYRREYFYAFTQRGIEESRIMENLPHYLCDFHLVKAINKIFVSLPEEKIRTLIENHASSLFSSVDKMEEHAFKIQRKAVPESFWNSLGKCSWLDRIMFNKHFFLFLLSSWLSEPDCILRQKRELKEAIATNNTGEECKILADRLLQLAFRICAHRVFHQILIFAKEHERLISIESESATAQHFSVYDGKESALTKLNRIYLSVFTEIYQPYIARKKVNWNLKTSEECLAQINLLQTEISHACVIKKQLSSKESLDARRFLDFIYAVLLHFRDNYTIRLVDLNNMATRTIIKPTPQQIPAQDTGSITQPETSILGVAAQSLKRKRKEKNLQIEEQCDPWTPMQEMQISSAPPDASADEASLLGTNTSLPLIDNIANIDTKPQTTICVQNTAITGTSQNPILHQLQGIEQSSPSLAEESQLISILISLPKLDELYYDENLMKLFIKNNDPRKYCYAELFTSALYTQAAWYKMKNRASDLMHSIHQERHLSVVQGNMGLAAAISNLINNKIKHQACLKQIQSDNFVDLPDSVKKTNKELQYEITKAKKTFRDYRRVCRNSLLQYGVEENTIMENLSLYLSGHYPVEAIKSIFVSLPKEKIKSLVQSHISSLSSFTEKMEERAFKIQRKPVPESFWHSLGKCSEQDWKVFNQHFFLFLLSSWVSEPEHLLCQKRELKEAVRTNNTSEECKILTDKLLQLAFRVGAKKVFHQLLSFAKEHERLISADDDIVRRALVYACKESILTKLNEAYLSVFTEIHLPYIERKKTDWNLKTSEECQAQINLLKAEINRVCVIKKRLSNEENSDVKRFLDFTYAVLLHFKHNYAIQLTDLNNIAARTITKPMAQQIQEPEASTASEQPQTSILGAAAQSLKRKRKEKHLQIEEQGAFIANSLNVGMSPEIGMAQTTGALQEMQFERRDTGTAYQEIARFEPEEYHNFLISLLADGNPEGPVN